VPKGEWTDHKDRLAAEWLQKQGVLVRVEVAGQAVQTAARDRPFHPVKTYLQGHWDGVERIVGWLSTYLGAEDTEYARAVGSPWLISAIARIFRPGAKADCCLILERLQGIRKSTALRTLAGNYFTDELADLRLVESPRQCIFAGTVNHSTYLRDETRGRRFWPIACGRIDVGGLVRDRDQLWGEAKARFENGAVWWLEAADLIQMASDQQIDRYEGDLGKRSLDHRWTRALASPLGTCWRNASRRRKHYGTFPVCPHTKVPAPFLRQS
jgi:predicted P-loop ATPase